MTHKNSEDIHKFQANILVLTLVLEANPNFPNSFCGGRNEMYQLQLVVTEISLHLCGTSNTPTT